MTIRPMTIRPAAVLFTALVLAPATAFAQAPQTVPEADPCVDGTTQPGGQPCATLSDKLGTTGGIIRPPSGVDPDIAVPAPDPMPGTTPVIPPGAVPPQPNTGDGTGTPAVPK